MVFNLPEQWTETSLGKVVRIEMGQSPKGTATNLEGHGIQLVGGAADLGEETPISERFTTAPTKVCEPMILSFVSVLRLESIILPIKNIVLVGVWLVSDPEEYNKVG